MPSLELEVDLIENTCRFKLSQSGKQPIKRQIPYSETLTHCYQTWRTAYLRFYQSGVRGRVEQQGVGTAAAIDWRAQLATAEAALLAEFHLWLNHAELFPIRKEIATVASALSKETSKGSEQSTVHLFLTCSPLDLARLPWETWELGIEFGAKPIRIVRQPGEIREEITQRSQHRTRIRVLSILGDETGGIDLAKDRDSIASLSKVADVQFVGWQPQKSIEQLKTEICHAIADEEGWDILFFAGHSNETERMGGELSIAPNVAIYISDIASELRIAQQKGLKFAIFNSCNGLNIAETLISRGLNQVAVMREPIRNDVAQEFLFKFLEALTQRLDVYEAMYYACRYLKTDKKLTYPSSYLIPSLFQHPSSTPFRLEPPGWKRRLRQWLPSRREAIALSSLMILGWIPAVQGGLLEQRVASQAIYRHLTGQVAQLVKPPIVLIQVDTASIQKAQLTSVSPLDRSYLAKLVNRAVQLDAPVIGLDFAIDRPHPTNPILQKSLQDAVKQKQTWFVLATREEPNGEWSKILTAEPTWSLRGDMWVPLWQVRPLQPDALPTLSYGLATAHRLAQKSSSANSALPRPNLQNTQDLTAQVREYAARTGKPYLTDAMQLNAVTAFSWTFRNRWLQPILDFSIPPEQVYRTISAEQFLKNPEPYLELNQAIIIIAPGGYDEAGIVQKGEDFFPLHPAVQYWRSQSTISQVNNRLFTGGEAHAYMTHHFLNHHFVIPIPDLWMILIAAMLGKLMYLTFRKRDNDKLFLALILGLTIAYGLVSLQLYLTLKLLLPWLLPSATVWLYTLPIWTKKDA